MPPWLAPLSAACCSPLPRPSWWFRTCLPCCGSATTARQLRACSVRRSDELCSFGPPSRGRLLGLGVLFVLAAALAFGGYRSYSQSVQAVAATQHRLDAVPTLRVQAVRASGDYVAVTLPATTSAFSVANIFARASGYIDKRNVDIGDHVKEGQLLVQIFAPELDHQIAQAKATLAQLEATVQQDR